MRWCGSKIIKCLPIMLLALFLVHPMSLVMVFAQEAEATLNTDKDLYLVGDAVGFNASGLAPGSEYVLLILYHDSLVYSLEFNSTSDGSLPSGIQWNSTFNLPGTYTVKLVDADGNLVSEGIFGLVEVNRYEFLPQESIVISGGGLNPNSIIVITVSDGILIFNGSVTTDKYGEFQVVIPIPFNITYGSYNVVIYSEGADPKLAFTVFVNSTVANQVNVIGVDLSSIIDVVQGLNTTIQQSILAKLENALKKIEQAEHYILLNRTHVARNMLNAAENMLNACVNELNAQNSKHIDNDTASNLISSIRNLMNNIEVSKSNIGKSPGREKQLNNAFNGEDVKADNYGLGKHGHKGSDQADKGKHQNNNSKGKGKDKHQH